MEKLEKAIWIITAIAVVVVIAFVAIGPFKSEIKDQAITDDFYAMNPHLDPKNKGRHNIQAPGPIAGRPRPTGPAPAGPGVTKVSQPGQRVEVVSQGSAPLQPEPPAWQPPPGEPAPVPYEGSIATTPTYLPESMAEKYSHFEDIVDLGMTAYGEDTVTASGEPAFALRAINENSPLSNKLGFQPGDVIISVNGYPASKGNARQLYETLKTQRDFRILIERGGQRQTLFYNIR